MIKIRRRAEARWTGTVDDGQGTITVQSGALDAPYSLRSRVGDAPHTNPEELIGAAHAGCFAMALTNLLSQRGHQPQNVRVNATVQLEEQDSGFSITHIELAVSGEADGIDHETFLTLAEEAKETCPVSRALAGTKISLASSSVTA